MNVRREAFFIEATRGQRFALLTRPDERPAGAILYVHPLAEEMNRSRRMAALAADAFARRGWAVLQIDLFGCGDSSGDFGDAGWQEWLDDMDLASRCLDDRFGEVPRAIWTLRAGSLLVSEWIARANVTVPLLCWQPESDGRHCLTRFLRLRAATEMLEESDATGVVGNARADLRAGRSVEVVGYRLSPALASGLESAALGLAAGYAAAVALIEVGAQESVRISPAVARIVDQWRQQGIAVESDIVRGPAFWLTPEIETAPALIERSIRYLDGVFA